MRRRRTDAAASRLREQFRARRGEHASVLVHPDRWVAGLVHNCMDNAVVLVEDPGCMTGVHFILLDRIERVAWPPRCRSTVLVPDPPGRCIRLHSRISRPTSAS